MKAVVVASPGGPEQLVVRDLPDPQPAPGEVVVEVVAAGVNRADLLQRQGFYAPPPGAPEWPGLECSGRIAALGEGVTGWTVGEEVCALLAGGGYAEQVAVPAGQVLPVPEGVGLVEAAALPEVASTVWSMVFEAGRLTEGEVLLVHGGSSGIGTMAIQLGVAFGATVAVTAGSAAKLERCRELGASVLVDYREQDFVAELKAATGGADVVLDGIGAKYLGRNVDVLRRGGRLVVIGMQGGVKGELDLTRLLMKNGTVTAASLRSRPIAEKAAIVTQVREKIWPLVASGKVRPVVDQVLSLAEAGQAHRVLDESGHVGKVLLTTGR